MNLHLTATVDGESRSWTLELSPSRVGRAASNAVQLLDPSVSREHAELTLVDGRWTIRDLGSRNGTRVNGVSVTGENEVRPGDEIETGHIMLRVGLEPTQTQWTGVVSQSSSVRLRVADVLGKPTAEIRDQGRVVRLLSEAGRMLVLPRPLRETCEEILGFVERAISANRLVVLLRRPDSDALDQIAGRYRGASAREPLALSSTIVRVVLDENTAVIAADAMSDPRFAGAQSIVGQLVHSAMAVPLFDNQHVLGILYVDSTNPQVMYAQDDLELLTLLANMAAVKISNARLLEDEERRARIAQELATATRIQRTLLPSAPCDVPGWSCVSRLESCYEVGGDLYDFHRRSDGRLVFLVGDVSGKGMGAALLMSSALSSMRVLYEGCDDPLALVVRLNDIVYRSTEAGSFLTLFVGWLDPETGRLHYVNAGHPEPVLALDARVRSLEATGIPVGMLPTFPWTMGEVTLDPGETLAVFSDGIPEAECGSEFFGQERAEQVLRELSAEPDLERVAEGLITRIDEFSAGAHRADDVTLVLLRRAAGVPGTKA